MRKPDGPQPVRYFSHELEGLHGLAIAPDFFTFVGVYAKLGCAGAEWWNWTRFGVEVGDAYHFDPQSEGARAWLAWLTAAPPTDEPPDEPPAAVIDEPPPGVIERSAADRRLLEAAIANDLRGVRVVLEQGANVDCTWREDWLHDFTVLPLRSEEAFSTAVTYAAKANNLEMFALLLERGATLNTRRLVMSDAVQRGSLATQPVLVLRTHAARKYSTLAWLAGEAPAFPAGQKGFDSPGPLQ